MLFCPGVAVVVRARVGREFPDMRQNERRKKFIREGERMNSYKGTNPIRGPTPVTSVDPHHLLWSPIQGHRCGALYQGHRTEITGTDQAP